MAKIKRKKVLAAAIEATIGTAETLDATDAEFNAYDIEVDPEIEFIPRPSQGSFGHLPGVLGARGGSLKFKHDLAGDGAAGVPTYASTFFPACGWVETTGTFSPVTEAPGTNVKTLTMAVYEDGLKKTLRGAAGKWKFVGMSGKIAVLEFEFMGIWETVADVAILAPDYPADIPLRFANTSLTLGGADPGCIETLEIESGNNVILRPCSNDVSGYKSGIITDRLPIGKLDPETQPVATNDSWGKWLSGTEEALNVVLTDGTDTITINAPKTQRRTMAGGDRNGIITDAIDFQCNKSADAGDDELTIDYS